MTDYSNQNITSTNLTGVDLSGANFTNTNATSVNFTNANITNANFTNTLITSATLTGITFSSIQKGQLLLRAANNTISAVNNLSSLTISELRRVQSAISLRKLNSIQSVTVAIPTSGGGYTVSITPSFTQAVCIFVAVNQNIVLSSSSVTVRTIRNNGTVIQDMDSSSATITHLKIGTVPYNLSAGNGNGVILLIPINLNMLKVNESGVSDILAMNTVTRAFSYYNAGAAVPKVTFNIGTAIDLRYNKVRGQIQAQVVPSYFHFPMLNFNNNHSYPTNGSSTSETNSIIWYAPSSRPQTSVAGSAGSIWDTNPNFAQFASVDDGYSTGGWFMCTFEITLLYNRGTGASRQLLCRGDYILSTKPIGTGAWQQTFGTYIRTSDIGGSVNLTHIGFGSYTQYSASNGISSCDLDFEIINLPSYTVQTTASN